MSQSLGKQTVTAAPVIYQFPAYYGRLLIVVIRAAGAYRSGRSPTTDGPHGLWGFDHIDPQMWRFLVNIAYAVSTQPLTEEWLPRLSMFKLQQHTSVVLTPPWVYFKDAETISSAQKGKKDSLSCQRTSSECQLYECRLSRWVLIHPACIHPESSRDAWTGLLFHLQFWLVFNPKTILQNWQRCETEVGPPTEQNKQSK